MKVPYVLREKKENECFVELVLEDDGRDGPNDLTGAPEKIFVSNQVKLRYAKLNEEFGEAASLKLGRRYVLELLPE